MKQFLLTQTLVISTLFSFAYSAPVSIKLGSLAPANSPWDKNLRIIGNEWAKTSGNTVNLKIYAGGIVGDEMDMIRKMKVGQLNAAAITGVGLCRISQEILALQTPLLISNNDQLAYVLGKMKPEFEQLLAAKGFTIVAWSTVGWVHFFSKSPVSTPDDLKKQKLFIWAGDPDGASAWKNMGFNPVPLAVTDLMTSLQSGMVDAFTTTPLSAASYQWFGLATNMCELSWAPLVGGIIVTNDTWNKIDASVKPQLIHAAAKISAGMDAESRAAEASALTIMQQHGLTINPVSQAALAAWKTVVATGLPKLFDKSIDKKTYDRIVALCAEFDALKKAK